MKKWHRISLSAIRPSRIDRDHMAIYGFTVIKIGEALGHGSWIDAEFLDNLIRLGNEAYGVKCRFTHPGLCSDGLGTLLGHAINFRLWDNGRSVVADLHLLKSASTSPKGDLATYVLNLADEAPSSFGASIVFTRDGAAEESFLQANSLDGRFVSPDKDNADGLTHFRIADLRAVDLVDDPATGAGFFDESQDSIQRAEATLSYVLGLSECVPDAVMLGAEPDRIRAFLNSYLQRNNLRIVNDSVVPNWISTTFAASPTSSGTVTLNLGPVQGSQGVIEMDLTKLSIDELRATRPDLIETIEKAKAEALEADKAKALETALNKATEDAFKSGLNAGVKAERERVTAIRQKATALQLPAEGDAMIASGLDFAKAHDQLRDARIAALEKGSKVVGLGSPVETPVDGPARWENEWNTDANIRAEFSGNKAAYLTLREKESLGLVKYSQSRKREQ